MGVSKSKETETADQYLAWLYSRIGTWHSLDIDSPVYKEIRSELIKKIRQVVTKAKLEKEYED